MSGNEHIQSILARAITDVGYLNHLKGINGGDTDIPDDKYQYELSDTLIGVQKFSAFITKVQHNFLWNDFNITFGLIHKYSLSIDVFTLYTPFHQKNKREKHLNNNEKIELFTAFLRHYLLAQIGRKYEILYCALEHENSIRILRGRVESRSPDRTSVTQVISVSTKLYINGWYVVNKSKASPRYISGAPASLKKVRFSKQEKLYCYWIGMPKKSLKIIAITKEIELVLTGIQDGITISGLTDQIADAIPIADTLRILGLLHQEGVIYFSEAT